MLSRQRFVPTKDLERYKLTFGCACERVEIWASLLSGIWFIPTPKELFLEKDFSEKCPHMKLIVSARHSYLGRHTFLRLLLLYFNNCFTAPLTDSVRRELYLSATARGNHMSLQIALSLLPSSSLERSKFQPHFCFPMNIREMVCYLAFISTGPMFVFY